MEYPTKIDADGYVTVSTEQCTRNEKCYKPDRHRPPCQRWGGEVIPTEPAENKTPSLLTDEERREPFVTTLTFTNVSIYRDAMFGVSRVDCRTLTVLTNQKYAQYNDAVRGQYVERGKRKPVSFVLGGCERWLVVLPTVEAIDPDTSLMLDGSGNCVSRYSSCDSRWRSDFEAKLAACGVKPLLVLTPEM